MSSNFACIGLGLSDQEAMEQLLSGLEPEARPDLRVGAEGAHRLWTDEPSGAALAFHVKRGVVECITPFFAPKDGLTRWSVRTQAPLLDPECLHCSGADCDVLDAAGEVVTRCTVQWLHFTPYRTWLKQPRTFELEVVAFAGQAQFFRSAATFEAAQRDGFGAAQREDASEPLRLAPNAVMPTGMFEDASAGVGGHAQAAFGGTVTRIDRRVNRSTGQPFTRVRVATLPGEVDVVVAGAQEAAAVGDQAWVEAWMVGRPVEPPPPKRGLLTRLFS